MTKFTTWESYFYPGTRVLKNKHDIRNEKELQEVEERIVRFRFSEALLAKPVDGNFDRIHMQEIHHHLFQDVYEWAGQPRVGPVDGFMSKNGPSPDAILRGEYSAEATHPYFYYPANEEMTKHFDRYAARLGEMAEGMSDEHFADEMAEAWGELNSAHMFREGNTRSQVVFFTYFAESRGRSLDYGRFLDDAEFRLKFNAGRFLVQHNPSQSQLLADVVKESLGILTQRETRTAHPPKTSDPYQPHYVRPYDSKSGRLRNKDTGGIPKGTSGNAGSFAPNRKSESNRKLPPSAG